MKNERAAKLLLLTFSTLFSLFIVELALRLSMPPGRVTRALMADIYTPHSEYGYAYRPNSRGLRRAVDKIDNEVTINSEGYHDLERSLEADAFRIVALGDSFTAAVYLPVAEGWTQALENSLQGSINRPIRVINRGLDGTGPDVHAHILEDYLAANPADLVVHAFFKNDLADVSRRLVTRESYHDYILVYQNAVQKKALQQFVDQNRPGALGRRLFELSYCMRLLVQLRDNGTLYMSNVVRPHDVGLAVEYFPESEHEQRLQDSLSRLQTLCESRSIPLLIAPIPAYDDPLASRNILEEHLPASLREQLEIVDINPVLTEIMEPGISRKDLYWRHNPHFNAVGNRHYAAALGRIVKAHLQQPEERPKP